MPGSSFNPIPLRHEDNLGGGAVHTDVTTRQECPTKGHTGKYADGDVETNEQNLCNSIFKALTNLDEFQLTLNNSEASFSESENVVSKTNHVRQEFFIGRDRPALPFSTSGQQRTPTQRLRLFFHAGTSKRFISLYTKFFSSLFKQCFPYRDEYPILDFIAGYFGD
ncbi:hypothetical protein TNCV_1895091 [Trichonephila clavipes]|nr:hypothetical protein TNCV_1895091 [Trichonephila clavipes]